MVVGVNIRVRLGRKADNGEVAETLADDPEIKAAVCVSSETSTGTVNDIEGFAGATGGVLTIVDAVSGLGACELRTDEWGVDVVVAGSQKALMTPPGLGFVSVSERVWEAHRESRMPRYYFSTGRRRRRRTTTFRRRRRGLRR